MKEIKAYIHNHRIADVIRALKDSDPCKGAGGCRNLSVVGVRSLLRPVDASERHYDVDLAEEVIRESKLELICEDDQVDELVAIIEHAARTGQAEAGWVYVTDIVKAVPVAGRP